MTAPVTEGVRLAEQRHEDAARRRVQALADELEALLGRAKVGALLMAIGAARVTASEGHAVAQACIAELRTSIARDRLACTGSNEPGQPGSVY